MLLTEYDEAKAMELFKEEGREEGIEQGFQLFGSLITKLLDQGRTEDIARAASDSKYRAKLLTEFQIA